jgi:hypothetical protein
LQLREETLRLREDQLRRSAELIVGFRASREGAAAVRDTGSVLKHAAALVEPSWKELVCAQSSREFRGQGLRRDFGANEPPQPPPAGGRFGHPEPSKAPPQPPLAQAQGAGAEDEYTTREWALIREVRLFFVFPLHLLHL